MTKQYVIVCWQKGLKYTSKDRAKFQINTYRPTALILFLFTMNLHERLSLILSLELLKLLKGTHYEFNPFINYLSISA